MEGRSQPQEVVRLKLLLHVLREYPCVDQTAIYVDDKESHVTHVL